MELAPEMGERLAEEGLDEVGLKAPSGRSVHVGADLVDVSHVHVGADQGPPLEQALDVLAFSGVVHGLVQTGFHVGPVAVADGFDEEAAKRRLLE